MALFPPALIPPVLNMRLTPIRAGVKGAGVKKGPAEKGPIRYPHAATLRASVLSEKSTSAEFRLDALESQHWIIPLFRMF